jgi:hypothetical protein
MMYRITRDGYALAVDGIVRHGDAPFDANPDALPVWDALHGALARGDVAPIASDSAPAAAPVVNDVTEAEPGESDGLDEMTRAELWRMYDGDALTYRSATREALIAALRGDDGE